MDSPLSPVVTNIFKENLESIAITTFRRLQKLCKLFVDDSCAILSKYVVYITIINEQIKFTL